jgi:hypothetical protein
MGWSGGHAEGDGQAAAASCAAGTAGGNRRGIDMAMAMARTCHRRQSSTHVRAAGEGQRFQDGFRSVTPAEELTAWPTGRAVPSRRKILGK